MFNLFLEFMDKFSGALMGGGAIGQMPNQNLKLPF